MRVSPNLLNLAAWRLNNRRDDFYHVFPFTIPWAYGFITLQFLDWLPWWDPQRGNSKRQGAKKSQEPRKSARPSWVEKTSSQTPGICYLFCESCAILCLPERNSHLGELIWIPRRNTYRLSFSLPGLVQLWISTWLTWELCGMECSLHGVDVIMMAMEVMITFESCCACFIQ